MICRPVYNYTATAGFSPTVKSSHDKHDYLYIRQIYVGTWKPKVPITEFRFLTLYETIEKISDFQLTLICQALAQVGFVVETLCPVDCVTITQYNVFPS